MKCHVITQEEANFSDAVYKLATSIQSFSEGLEDVGQAAIVSISHTISMLDNGKLIGTAIILFDENSTGGQLLAE